MRVLADQEAAALRCVTTRDRVPVAVVESMDLAGLQHRGYVTRDVGCVEWGPEGLVFVQGWHLTPRGRLALDCWVAARASGLR